jgi:nucleotide-binding universal stress UspA family protein
MSPTIVHATDLIHDDSRAFEHGIALARAAKAKLISLHANAPEEAAAAMSDAARVLIAWGDEPDAVEFERKVHNCCDDPVDTILDAIRKVEPDLVIASTHQRSALARFLGGSAAEAIAHNAKSPTLLLPVEARGFVAGENGALDLHRILVPIGDEAEAARAVASAAWIAEIAGVETVEFVLLHVGEPTEPSLEPLTSKPGWTARCINVQGTDIEKAIVTNAVDACLIVMATRGHDTVSDVLRGSHTDRVLHKTHCPVLSVGV